MFCAGQKYAVLVLPPFISFAILGWSWLAPQTAVANNECSNPSSDAYANSCQPVDSTLLCSSTCSKSGGATLARAPISKYKSAVPEEAKALTPYTSQPIEGLRNAINSTFPLTTHKANYLLPAAYRELPGETRSAAADRYGVPTLDPLEVQFQLSLQLPLWSGFLGENSFLSVAYTNLSFWQAYTGSGIFREIDHEVELIATWSNNRRLLGFHNIATQVGVSHQSNGRGASYSRGWNRIYTNFIFERDNYFVALKPWYRFSKERNKGRGPDFDFYYGNFELTAGYHTRSYSLSIMLRNNLRSSNRGALELSWSFPISKRLRGIVKYFDGYGESLIDYATRVQTLGIGLEIAPDL